MKPASPAHTGGEPGVAPSRGRGLKLKALEVMEQGRCRPFTGAWIETSGPATPHTGTPGRPFTGAWIETICGNEVLP